MTRELFVSSTPHETKVGMVEDDLLAEIYLERENEYTLAGSIYKGRVTRVLPGMQSAFVDIGLERDAFLYVSDFMELEDSEDLDEVPTNRPVPERHQPQPQAEAHNGETFAAPVETESQPQERLRKQEPRIARRPRPASRAKIAAAFAAAVAVADAAASACRNRSSPARQQKRRARLHGLNGQNAPTVPNVVSARHDLNLPNEVDDPSGHPEQSGQSVPNTDRRRDTSPSFCRESRSPNIPVWPSAPPAPSRERLAPPVQEQPARPLAEVFADDEPIFAAAPSSVVVEAQTEVHEEPLSQHQTPAEEETSAWDREQQRLHQMNVAAVFGGEAAEMKMK